MVDLMSRSPLLVRSSPAQGTGSYGAVPTQDLEEYNAILDQNADDLDDVRRRNRRKGRESALSRTPPQSSSSHRSVAYDVSAPRHRSKSKVSGLAGSPEFYETRSESSRSEAIHVQGEEDPLEKFFVSLHASLFVATRKLN